MLWWTYATIKWDLDAKPIHTWLLRTVHNENAFLTFSIIATILTVSVFRKNKFPPRNFKKTFLILDYFTPACDCNEKAYWIYLRFI